MGWFLLSMAILFEIAGTTSMKLSDGFSNLWPTVLVFIFYGFCFAAMIFALKHVDLGTAYAVWAGVGTAVVAIIGAMVFGESMTVGKVVCIALIIAGVVGLRLSDSSSV